MPTDCAPVGPFTRPYCDENNKCGLWCEDYRMDCDGEPSNGCEVDVVGDPTNCGDCGVSCTVPNTVDAYCDLGCRYTCAEGWFDYDGDKSNGCEQTIAAACAASGGDQIENMGCSSLGSGLYCSATASDGMGGRTAPACYGCTIVGQDMVWDERFEEWNTVDVWDFELVADSSYCAP